MKIFASDVSLGGEPLTNATLGEPSVIEMRDVELAGILADNSPFHFRLNPNDVFGQGFVSPDAMLTVTLVSQLPGDYDSNGSVDQGDLDLVLLNWGDEIFNPFTAGWINDLPEWRYRPRRTRQSANRLGQSH